MTDKKKKELIRGFTITTNINPNVLAKKQAIYKVKKNSVAYGISGDKDPIFKYDMKDDKKSDDIFSYNTNTDNLKDLESETSKEEENTPKTSQQISDEKYFEYLKEEEKNVDDSIKEMKTELAGEYDKYVELAKDSEYYKRNVQRWEEYYENKRREFELETEKVSEKPVEPKEEVNNTVEENPEAEKVAETDDREDTSDWNVDFFAKSIKLNAKEMGCDPSLKKTIEQILLDELYNSFDENRDAYSKELSDLEGMKRIPKVYRDIVESRLHISENLVQSYTKMFDMTNNKTVKKLYKKNVKEVQRDLESYKNDMDSSLATDMVMSQLYGMDLRTKQNTGLIPELAEYLAVRVQQELLKRGRAEFNLYKSACEKVLNDVLLETKFATKIVEKDRDVKADPKIAYHQELGRLIKALKRDLKDGTRNVNADTMQKAADFLEQLKTGKHAFDEEAYEDVLAMLHEIDNVFTKLSLLKDSEITAEDKRIWSKFLRNIELQNNVMLEVAKKRDVTRAENNINKRYELENVKYKFDENGKLTSVLPKKNGLRPITDWIAKKVLENIGSKVAKDELKTFEFNKKDKNELKTEMIGILDAERNPDFDLTRYLLFYIQCAEHDIREMVKKENNYKYKYAQSVLDVTTKLLRSFETLNDKNEDEFRKKAINVINDYIALSQYIKPEGKARRKAGLEEAKVEIVKD